MEELSIRLSNAAKEFFAFDSASVDVSSSLSPLCVGWRFLFHSLVR
jgi:hypothetical protein